MTDESNSDWIATPPLGSCIHCGSNIWESDYVGFESQNNSIVRIYRCKRCTELNRIDELIPF